MLKTMNSSFQCLCNEARVKNTKLEPLSVKYESSVNHFSNVKCTDVLIASHFCISLNISCLKQGKSRRITSLGHSPGFWRLQISFFGLLLTVWRNDLLQMSTILYLCKVLRILREFNWFRKGLFWLALDFFEPQDLHGYCTSTDPD